jgi:hypothetical protein
MKEERQPLLSSWQETTGLDALASARIGNTGGTAKTRQADPSR